MEGLRARGVLQAVLAGGLVDLRLERAGPQLERRLLLLLLLLQRLQLELDALEEGLAVLGAQGRGGRLRARGGGAGVERRGEGRGLQLLLVLVMVMMMV